METGAMMKTRLMSALLLAAFLSVPLWAQAPSGPAGSAGEVRSFPAWVLCERGKAELERRDLGRALFLFQMAIEKAGNVYPEAEEALGDVYQGDGQLVLAESKYLKAYSLKGSLVVPEDAYRIRMKLARLYFAREDYRRMEAELEGIALEDPYYGSAQFERLQVSMATTYREKGLDAMMRAYRVATPFALEAHAELGWLQYRLGHEGAALRSLILAADGVVSLGMEELRRADPEYGYTTMVDFLGACSRREETARLLEDSGFFRTLYYLTASAQLAGYRERARQGWQLLAAARQAGRYAELAARQLQSPWHEPVINPSARELETPAVR